MSTRPLPVSAAARRSALPPQPSSWRCYEVFGLSLAVQGEMASDLPPTDAAADVVFEIIETPLVAEHAWGPPLREHAAYALHRVGDVDVLRFVDEAWFFLGERWIGCYLADPSARHIAEIRLLGGVLAYWLESHGVPTLHASAVVVDGSAVAFAAPNGGGKTSLAAELVRRGHPLLTDDILPIELRGGAVFGLAGYPQMRMWPDEARRHVGAIDGLRIVHPAFDKLRVPVGDAGIGAFCPEATELGAVYLLYPVDGEVEPGFEPVAPGAAVVHLAAAGFAAPVATAGRQQAGRFRVLAAAAATVPVWWLTYGRHSAERAGLVEAVLAHVRHLMPAATDGDV
jgi:hypothetical protein